MAKNKIEIDVEVDDKGTTQKLAVESKKAAKEVGGVAKSAGEADRNIKGAAQASANGTKNFSKMAQGMGGLVQAYATVAATVFAVSAAFQFLKQAADYRVIKESQVAFSSATGVGMRSLTKDLQNASDNMLSFKDASEAAAIGIASGLNQTQLKQLGEGAANVSKILGRDVTDSFNRLIRGVTKAEPELLDELGITLRLADAQEKYAAKLGKSAKTLSMYEKKQAVFNEVQGQLEEKYNRIAELTDINGNALNKLAVAFDRVLNPIKDLISDFAEPAAIFFTNNIKSLAIALAALAVPIIKSIIPGLENFAASAQASSAKATKALKTYQKQVEELKKKRKELAETPITQAREVVSGVKARKGSGLEAFQAGEELSKRQLQGMIRAAEQQKGVFKNMTEANRRIYLNGLRQMQAGNKKFQFSWKTTTNYIVTTTQIATRKMQATWAGAMRVMSRATLAFSKVANTASKAAGFIGLALIIKDLGSSLLSYLGLFQKDTSVVKFTEALQENTRAMRDNIEETKNFAEIQRILMEDTATGESFAKPTLTVMKSLGQYLGTTTNSIMETVDAIQKVQGIANNQVADSDLARRGGGRLRREGQISNIYKDVDIKDAQNTVAQSAKNMIAALQATGVASTKAGKEFLELNNILFYNRGLTEDQQKRYGELAEQLKNTGGEAAVLLELQTKNRQEYMKTIAGVTQYQSAVSSLLNSLKAEKEEILRQDFEGKQAQIALVDEQIAKIQELHDIEVRLAAEKARIEANASGRRGLFGGSPGSLMQGQYALEDNVSNAQAQADAARRNFEFARNNPTTDPEVLSRLRDELAKSNNELETAKFNLTDIGQISNSIEESLGTGLMNGINGLIQGTMSLKDAFKSMAVGILEALAQVLAKMIAIKIIESSIGFFSAGSATNTSAMNSASMGNYAGYARYGGTFSDGKKVSGYSMGGIAKGSDAGYPAMLHGTEAVVPLPNNRSIPVDLKGAGQNNNVVVNVNMDNAGATTSTSEQSGMDAGKLGQAVAQAVQKELQNQKRSGGILSPYGAA